MPGVRTSPERGGPEGIPPASDDLPLDFVEAVRRVFAGRIAALGGGHFWERWRGTLRLLRPLGAVSRGNRLRLLPDGDEAFEAMWEALDGAEKSVLFNTYIIADDRVGRRTRDALTRAAQRGCRVHVVCDGFGSAEIDDSFFEPLRQAGGVVYEYNPPLRLFPRFSRLMRNHRKILVVDDTIGFCGGMNTSEDYAGKRHGNGLFRDVQVEIEGPAVRDLANLVLRTIRELDGRAPLPPIPHEPWDDGHLVQVLESNVRREKLAIQKALRYTVVRSVDRCFLTSPYFVPPRRFMRILMQAARRGIDVRILTAGRSDVPLVRMASQHLYGRLLRAGVRIFEMQERTLHAKTVAIDGVYGSIGSFNLDYWSYRRNLEVTVSVLDEGLAQRLEERFQEDLGLSSEVQLTAWRSRTLGQRLLHWFAYQLMSL